MKALITALLAIVSIASFGQKPTITSADRMRAGNGDIITLQGNNFGTDPSKLVVFFGASKGTINFASDQFIEAQVPAGATYDKISVTNTTTKLTGYTSDNFLYSYGGEHGFGPDKLEGQKDFNAESGLYDLCLCDFDGDGKTDIATASNNSNSMAILANTTSAPGLININFSKIPFLPNARSLHTTCGDLNGDGKPDMVISEGGETANRIFIYRNTSTGIGNFTFAVESITLTDKKTKRMIISDLDLDGKPEILITNQSANNITVLVNQSNASSMIFSPTTIVIPGAASTDGIAVDDLNGDILPEVVVSQFNSTTNYVYILRNTSTPGNIALAHATTLTGGSSVANLKIGDLDNDQKPDIAVTYLVQSAVSVFLNLGTGNAITFSTPHHFSTNGNTFGLDFGDLDGDGKTDMVVAATVKWITLFNNKSTPGNLSFQITNKPTTFINRHVKIGDIDGDAKPDIAFTSIDDNQNGIFASKISIFRNTACLKPELGPEGPHNVCSGLLPLQLNATPSLGTTYIWKNGATQVATGTDPFYDVMASGNYTVTATAEGGTCALESNPVAVTVNPGTTTGPANPVNNGPVCVGSTLTLSADSVGGTEYRWTGPEGFTASGRSVNLPNFQQPNAGRYYLEVLVGTCVAQQTSTVVDAIAIPDFEINIGASSVACPPGTKTLTITPNLSTFTYQWFEKTTGIIAGATSASFNAPTSGEYYVEAQYTANPACASVETAPVKITFATPPLVAFQLPSAACAGQNVTFTDASTIDSGVTAAFTWEFGDGSTATTQHPTHRYLTANNFTVKLTVSYDDGACSTALSKNLTVQPAPPVTITNAQNKFSFCPEDSLVLQVTGTFTSYAWSTGDTGASITVSDGGVYTVDVTTSTGCVITATREVTLLEPPTVTITADPKNVKEGKTAQLSVAGLDNVTWEPAETLNSATIINPVASPLVSTAYKVSGTDANGCYGEAIIEITVIEGSVYGKLTPSKFFSPANGDELGKFWIVDRIEDFQQCQVTVYDDKGVKVHEAKPYFNNWDGTFNGQHLPDGVYYFIIKCEGEETRPKTGSITILR